MEFPLDVEWKERSLQVIARVSTPEPDSLGRDMWTCAFEWDNASFGRRTAYGATALQALALAIPLLETSLRSEFPGARITMAGAPFAAPEDPAPG